MTAQANDTLYFEGREFSIVGIKGSGMFDPKLEGLPQISHGTICHRGYFCEYEVDDRLKLQRLFPGFSPSHRRQHPLGRGPRLFGRAPRPLLTSERGCGLSEFVFDEIDQVIPFTGGLLIGREFIKKPVITMGLPSVYKFKEVQELKFNGGSLSESRDVSAESAARREELESRSQSPEESWGEVFSWIDQGFDWGYTL